MQIRCGKKVILQKLFAVSQQPLGISVRHFTRIDTYLPSGI